MGTSLAFHYIFASLGVGLPLLLVVVEGRWLRTRDPIDYEIARTWSRAMLLLFAIGAVSGTTLSFELGLLWPQFMQQSGSIIGIPFSAEGFAFFIEAIFVGIYLYGWDKLSPRAHWFCAIAIAVSGAASAVFVVSVNAWMNTPAGYVIVAGSPVAVDLWRAFFNPSFFTEALHTTLGAYVFVGFAVAAVSAWQLLRSPLERHANAALRTGMVVAAIAIPLQVIAGDLSARFDANVEPVKFAATEAHFKTSRGAPLLLGGIADQTTRTVPGALEVPYLLSFLAFGDPNAEVRGLDAFPRNDEPPVAIVHSSFDVMVVSGTALLFVAAWWAAATRFGRRVTGKWLSRALVVSGFLAFFAMEAGWFVTEFGRQPWVVHDLLRTSDAVTTAPALDLAFYGFSVLYIFLAATLVLLLNRIPYWSAPEPARDSTSEAVA
jgi:cytochrome bd ubiquinol oxidase subunit I